jgi:hypothetical protein
MAIVPSSFFVSDFVGPDLDLAGLDVGVSLGWIWGKGTGQ